MSQQKQPGAQGTAQPHFAEGQQKQGGIPHFIPAWANALGMSQADIVKATGADKGSVSKWFNGSTPFPKWQKELARIFGTTPEGLFRHPDEMWMAGFLSERPKAEVDRIKATLEAAFPKKPQGTR